jgi:replicative DNA helicase
MYGCKVIFIDYIQIVQWENQSLPRHEQVAEISKGLKQLARELKVPIVTLAQLRRDAEGREPEMADLGDSSQIEKDADTLLFIYHPKAKEGEAEKSLLLVKKNRDGAKGAVRVVFRREYVKFYEEERE